MPHRLAEILERAPSSLTFAVDAVAPATASRETKPLRDTLEAKLTRPLLGCNDADRPVVDWDSGRMHPLVYAVTTAFFEHRPLCLRPDDIWLTIAQGFACHVNHHAEGLRDRFVRHAGRMRLVVETSSIERLADWEAMVPAWAGLVREQLIDPAVHDALICDFSTTTPAIRTASQIVLMETFRQYFYYEAYAICGIPTVTLLGTVDDWQAIRSRVETLADYALEWWTSRLRPICDALVASSQGKPPLRFWQAIVAPQEVYGGTMVKGWLADLFPYIGRKGETRNILFDIPPGDWKRKNGIHPDYFPPGLSTAPVKVTDAETGKVEHFELLGGFLGASQDDALALRPEIGWAIRRLGGSQALLQESSKHRLMPVPELTIFETVTRHRCCDWFCEMSPYYREDLPPEYDTVLGDFYQQCNGGELYAGSDHRWLMYPFEKITLSTVDAALFVPFDCPNCFTFGELPDGRKIVLAFLRHQETDAREVHIVLGTPEIEHIAKKNHSSNKTFRLMRYAAATTRVIAHGTEEFFNRILCTGGRYYFDDDVLGD